MPSVHITRDLEFDAGHRVLGHESKCAHLHGHRYKAEVMVESPELDSLGRVVDFSIVKTLIGGWIDANWDHNMILHADDPLLKADQFIRESFGAMGPPGTIEVGEPASEFNPFGHKRPYVMPIGRNTTAEHLAMELAAQGPKLLPSLIRIVQVTIHETPNCRATYVVD